MERPLLKYFYDHAAEFEALSDQVAKKPTKKEVHQLRVAVRRIRISVWLAEKSLPHKSFKKVSQALRKLTRALGSLRELDIAIEDAEKYRLDLKKLKSRRKRAQKDLVEHLSKKRRTKILHELKIAFKQLAGESEIPVESSLAKLQLQLDQWMHKSKIKTKDLHDLRITAKKTRYALEALGKPTKPLKNLQSLLGRGHDLQVLLEMVGRHKTIREDMRAQNKIAKQEIRPTLQFALKELASAPHILQ